MPISCGVMCGYPDPLFRCPHTVVLLEMDCSQF